MLKDQVAIVTGGGRGIGRGIVDKMLASGAKVLIAQRSIIDADLKQNKNVKHLQVDLAQATVYETIVQTTLNAFGQLDCIVNNAGIMFERSLDEMTTEEWDLMMAVNLRAPMLLSQAALPYLRKSKNASIINIGSIEGDAANPNHAAYCSSKSGIHGLTKALAIDLGKDAIRVNAIAPGWIRSELSDAYINAQENAEQAKQDLLNLHPIGRVGIPDDIGNMAVYLASNNSQFLTGQIITVDGGRMSKIPLPF